MPLVQTRGAASAQGFGEFAQSGAVNYIEEVFSTYLYAGTDANQAINNGVDLSGKGGMIWLKARNQNTPTVVFDTNRGASPTNSQMLWTASSDYNFPTSSNALNSFNSNGFTLGADDTNWVNFTGINFASWTFRKQPKFFDVVTYTGTGSNTTIAHSLGSVPGSIIVKRTDTTAAWAVYHRSLANTQYMVLNTYAAAATGATWWNSTTPTSSVFSVGTDASVNASGGTYVAYLFAHDAGGFGLAGTDNVISCGSFTTDGSGGCNVNLGYEPQWILSKSSTIAVPWAINDTMRGFTSNNTNNSNLLDANTSGAEYLDSYLEPTSTGFKSSNQLQASAPYIYIACRRGPMKVPTLGTSVYNAIARTGTGAAATITGVGFPPDLVITGHRTNPTYGFNKPAVDRLRGAKTKIYVDATSSEGTTTDSFLSFNMDGFSLGADGSEGNWNENSATLINWSFKRAPGFFDEVCYTGTGSGQVINHNLGVTPELLIFKARNNYASSGYEYWYTNAPNTTYALALNLDVGESYTKISSSNSTTVSLGSSNNYVLTNQTYVAYLFATCAGVSKVFSYTGNGSSQTINCGFTAGSRFVLIKRTDSTGDWYVWDSARGIVAGNDPHLSLNTTAAEVTTDDSVDTDSTGFIVNQVAATNVNVSSATYIGLAVA